MWRWTASGLAMAAYRHRFLEPGLLCHVNEPARALERESYYGGETECYRIGEFAERVQLLDVSSMYGAVMRGGSFPFKIVDYQSCHDKPRTTQPDIDPSASIAEVTVNTNRRTVPLRGHFANGKFTKLTRDGLGATPYRNQQRTLHVLGTIRTTLAGPELADLAAHGEIVAWHKWTTYEMRPLFKEYMEFFWAMRRRAKENGDQQAEHIAKISMNGLYGKFGQRAEKWLDMPGLSIGKRWGNLTTIGIEKRDVKEFRAVAGIVQQKTDQGEHINAVPSIASFVTSFGREFMGGAKIAAGKSHTLYQAVDSLIVDETGYQNLLGCGMVEDATMGKFRRQMSAHYCRIVGCNAVQLDAVWRLAGLPNINTQIDHNTFECTTAEKMDAMLERTPDMKTKERVVNWKIPTKYSRASVDLKGQVSPFVITPDGTY